MAYEARFRYVPDGPLYPYRQDYATAAEAAVAETWIATNGFWYQRPDSPTVHTVAQTVVVPTPALLLEDGAALLAEDLSALLLE